MNAKHVFRCGFGAFEASAVLAVAVLAGSVIDGLLNNVESGTFDQCRDKTMHAGEGHEGFAAFAAHDFEAAAGIADSIPGEAAADTVGDATLHPLKGGVFAIGAVATDEIGVLGFESGHQLGNVVGVVLKIAIDEGDEFALGPHHAFVHGGALAGVLVETQDANTLALPDAFDSRVGRTIIDEDEFVVDPVENLADFLLHGLDVVLLIVEGNDERKFGAV